MNNSYYNVSHSRDYYKGKSVEFAGEWTSGTRYFNDEYLNSLVVYAEKDATGNIIHSALLACKQTHIAAYNSSVPDSTNNQPHLIVDNDLGIVGIEPNDYWIFVSGSLIGTPGKSTEIVNTYLEALTFATESNIGKIVFAKEEKSAYLIIGAGELKKIVSTSELLELAENKVDKELGKGLSTNDYSNTEKAKLKGIEENAQRNVIEEIALNGVKIDPIDKTISINTVGSINEQTGDITLRDNSETVWDVNLHIENNQIQGEVVTPKSVGSETTPVYFNENGEATPINIDTEVTENSNNLVTSNAVHKKLDLKQDRLITGDNITIQDNIISATNNIDLSDYAKTEDVDKKLDTKQDKLIAGNGIQIVDSIISSTVDTNPFIVVSKLPSVGENGKTYLTPAEKPENNNLADEWIWNNNSWERLGSASIDLSNYPKLVDLTDIINNEADNYITEARFNELKELLSTPNTIFYFNKDGMYYYSTSIDLSKISDAPSGNDFESINNIVIYFPIKQDSSGVYGYELVLISGFNRSSYDFWWSINLTPIDFSVRVYNGVIAGLVPTPLYGSTKKYLNVNGQWTTVKSSELDNDSGFITASDVATKQDIIPDLNTIREGANKGSTALQSESDPIYIADKPNIAFKNEIPDISVKVDKEEGKGLSSNDYTDAEKAKLTELQQKMGDLADLETEDNTSLVAAINEAAHTGGGGGNVSGFVVIHSVSDLPINPTPDQQTLGYLLDRNLVVYVGSAGDILDGKYKDCGEIKGVKGDKGDPGEQGIPGVQGEQGEKGDKGEQGNTGSSIDYPFEIVNNITEGGVEKALSAEMGKYLAEATMDKETVIIATTEYTGKQEGYLAAKAVGATCSVTSSTNLWYSDAIPVKVGMRCTMKSQGTGIAAIAWKPTEDDRYICKSLSSQGSGEQSHEWIVDQDGFVAFSSRKAVYDGKVYGEILVPRGDKVGKLDDLLTENTENAVAAINEVCVKMKIAKRLAIPLAPAEFPEINMRFKVSTTNINTGVVTKAEYSGQYISQTIHLEPGDAIMKPASISGYWNPGANLVEVLGEDSFKALENGDGTRISLYIATRPIDIQVGINASLLDKKVELYHYYAYNFTDGAMNLSQGRYNGSISNIYNTLTAFHTGVYEAEDNIIIESDGEVQLFPQFFDEDGNQVKAESYTIRQSGSHMIQFYPGAKYVGFNIQLNATGNITEEFARAHLSIKKIGKGDTPAPTDSGKEVRRMRVCTFNLGHFGKGKNYSTITNDNYAEERAEWRRMLNAIGADFMCVEEYQANFNTSTGETCESAIFDALYSVSRQGPLGGGGGYLGQKIFGNIEPESMVVVPLGGERDHYLLDTTYTIGGKVVHIGCTHIAWESQEIHDTQFTNLCEYYETVEADLIVIAGDFNMHDDFAIPVSYGFATANGGYMGALLTYPVGNFSQALDSVLVKGGKILHTEFLEGTASDHIPLFCDIAF